MIAHHTALLVENQPKRLYELKTIFDQHSHLDNVSYLKDSRAAQEELQNQYYDILILGERTTQRISLACLLNFRSQSKRLKILALLDSKEDWIMHKLMLAQVEGILLRNAGALEYQRSVEHLLGHKTYYCNELENWFENQRAVRNGQTHITKKEHQVLQLIADEHTTYEIAEVLGIRPNTVETHRKNILRKLGVRNVAGMIRKAMHKGLIS